MRQWIELSYDEQLRIIALIDRATAYQNDDQIREGLDAAMAELMMWSNSPAIELDEVEEH